MELNAKSRLLNAASEQTQLTAADAKEAAAFLSQTFAKHGLTIKVKVHTAGDLICTQKTPHGPLEFHLALTWKKSGATFIEVDFTKASLFNVEGLSGDGLDISKLGKKGVREFRKFALSYAKDANAAKDQLQFAGEWITKFAAAFQEINEAMAANKTKVGKEYRG